jgi:hypothetical protein
MSLYIDMKFLSLVSHRIPKYKRKSDYLVNCRCTYCGDSSSNPNKGRGYFYRQKNDLFYKCHNCGKSIHFGTYLKDLDSTLYKEYVFERYAKGENGPKAHKDPVFKFEEPVFDTPIMELRDIATRLSELPDDNEAVAYCLGRGIPRERFKELYFMPQAVDVISIAPKYEDVITSEVPRLCIPFFNAAGELVGLTLRALRGEKLRYINVSIRENEPLVFGLKNIDKSQDILVLEGAIDSLFLKNAIAINGSASKSIYTLGLPQDKLIVVLDNEPRNADTVRLIEGYIENGIRVCIWPSNMEEKDINDMVTAGIDVNKIIHRRAFNGLRAKIEFSQWKKV